jgi:hypothetical protein
MYTFLPTWQCWRLFCTSDRKPSRTGSLTGARALWNTALVISIGFRWRLARLYRRSLARVCDGGAQAMGPLDGGFAGGPPDGGQIYPDCADRSLETGVFGSLVAGMLVIAALPKELLDGIANHTSLTAALSARALGTFWLTFVMFGVALMISGAISFRLYPRHNEAPAQDGE